MRTADGADPPGNSTSVLPNLELTTATDTAVPESEITQGADVPGTTADAGTTPTSSISANRYVPTMGTCPPVSLHWE